MNNKTNASVCQGENAHLSKIDENGIKSRQPCHRFTCPHHMFYEKIFSNNGLSGQRNHLIPCETDVSRKFFNCMCEVDRPLTLEEIGEMYLVSGRATIARIVKLALGSLRKQRKHLKNLKDYYDN